MTSDAKELAIAVAAIVAIGAGLWWYQPWVSLVGVGSIVLGLTILGRVMRA